MASVRTDEAEPGEARLNLPLWKKLVFSFVPVLVLLIVCEVGLRLAHYQFTSKHAFAISHAVTWIKARNRHQQAREIVKSVGVPMEEIYDELFTDSGGENLLRSLKEKYREHFQHLVRETQGVGAELAVLFIPTPTDKGGQRTPVFFRDLATKNELPFLDLTENFKNYTHNQLFLLPENGHPSRLGYSIIAGRIEEYLAEVGDYRTTNSFSERPQLLGDLRPNMNEVMSEHLVLPYRMVTNTQGLRMKEDLEFPKTKQRILFLGDSYTYGSYVPDEHTFVGELAKRFPEKEMVNAGRWGYTIVDVATLFSERAKYVEPDIVIVQVLENDIFGLMSVKLMHFSRVRGDVVASEEEVTFLDDLKIRNRRLNTEER